MKRLSCGLLCLLLALTLLVPGIVTPASAAAEEYALRAEAVGQTVELSFLNLYDDGEGDEGTWFYGLDLLFDVKDSSGYLSLTELRPGGPAGASAWENDAATGHVLWMDSSYANGILAKVNAPIWTAVYTGAPDVPAGTYTLRMTGEVIGLHPDRADEFGSDTGLEYTASVTLGGAGDAAPDLNGDGAKDLLDAHALFAYASGSTAAVKDPAQVDVDGDEKVSSRDALLLFRRLAGGRTDALY